jgi:hypothetical protein
LSSLIASQIARSGHACPAEAAYFEASPGLVDDASPPEAKVAFYAALFAARTGKSGRVPAVRGGWRKGSRHEDRDYCPLTPAVLAAHLKGETHTGLYPLMDGDRCWWLAADFDGPEAMFDALMYVRAGRALQVPVALEVSRSGVGEHHGVEASVDLRGAGQQHVLAEPAGKDVYVGEVPGGGPVEQGEELVAGELFRGERGPGRGHGGGQVRRRVHGQVDQDPAVSALAGSYLQGIARALLAKDFPDSLAGSREPGHIWQPSSSA